VRSWINTWPYEFSLLCCLTLGSDIVVQALAPKYFSTRFLRVFVENVPFLVEKLGLKVLPCVVSFIKGVSKDRYVQWLAKARILCLLTLHAGLSASKNLAMWTVLALPPWSSGCCIQVRFLVVKRRDLNIKYHQTRGNQKGFPLGACCQQRTCCCNTWYPPTPESP
jgi:hypothetical protein